MPTPPPLSSESVARMTKVVEQADAAVDNGTEPALALAKAARDHGLPVGHVPIVTRSFNTGRAVRQLNESDPWAKAADHPTATAAQVCAALDELGAPPAPRAKAASDYASAPGTGMIKIAAAAPFVMSEWTKAAVAKAELPVVAAPASKPHYLSVRAKAAAILDQLRDAVSGLKPEQYSAVKRAAAAVWAAGADDTFTFLEGQNTHLWYAATKAASAHPDPTITTAHPAIAILRDLRAVREQYQEPGDGRPLGYQKVAGSIEGWFVPKPRIANISLEPRPATTVDAIQVTGPDVTKFAGVLSGEPETEAPAPAPRKSPPTSTLGAMGRGAASAFLGPLNAIANNGFSGPLTDITVTPPASGLKHDVDKTKVDLGHVDLQSNLQDVVSDPRLIGSDPKTVVQTYQQLTALAPNVMQNPSVAADFIHRRMQTGPLSAFDHKQLLDMEKVYNSTRKPSQIDDDDI